MLEVPGLESDILGQIFESVHRGSGGQVLDDGAVRGSDTSDQSDADGRLPVLLQYSAPSARTLKSTCLLWALGTGWSCVISTTARWAGTTM